MTIRTVGINSGRSHIIIIIIIMFGLATELNLNSQTRHRFYASLDIHSSEYVRCMIYYAQCAPKYR